MTFPSRFPGPLLAAVTSLFVLLDGGAPAAAQPGPAGPRVIIAQGTAWLPAEPVVWWAGEHVLPEAAPAGPSGQNLGFVLGQSGVTTIISDGAPGEQLVWLDPGEALFVPRDLRQERFSPGPPASYVALNLIPAAAGLPGPAQPVGGAFTPVDGLHELTLRRDLLDPGQTAVIPPPSYPALLLVTAGAVEISADSGERFRLNAGDAATIETGAALTAISLDPASFVLAEITTRGEQAPATGAADLGIWVLVCPPGVTARPDMTTAGCDYVDPLASGVEVAISGPATASPLTLANSGFGDAGARVWGNVPFGAYTLTATLPPGAIGYAVRPVVASFRVSPLPGSTGYTFTLDGSQFDPRSDYWRQNLELYLLYP